MNRLGEQLDRTRLIFYPAGILVGRWVCRTDVQFAAGLWAYIFGATSRSETGGFQYDALSLLPGALSFSCLLMCVPLLARTHHA